MRASAQRFGRAPGFTEARMRRVYSAPAHLPEMLRRIVARLARTPLRVLRQVRARPPARRLAAHPDPAMQAIGRALVATLDGRLSPTEHEAARRIEARRTALLRSDQRIPKVDYGAGTAADRRTAAEMQGGVASVERVADVCRASKPAFWAAFLLALVRETGPTSCVELGTCVGISAAYQAAALGPGAALWTLEGSPEIARLARETLADFPDARVVVGPFDETLASVLAEAAPVDLFFNDGHHDEHAVLRYFEAALPHLAPGAVVAFDDIGWSPGMRRAWNAIERHERVAGAIDLETMGIVVVGPGGPGAVVRIPLS